MHPHPAGVSSDDTDAEAERRQVQRWRSMSPAEKFRVVAEMNAAVDTMARAGIQSRYPLASPRERFLRLAVLKLGPDVARKAYPEIAALDVV
jgi:hypothetical protein